MTNDTNQTTSQSKLIDLTQTISSMPECYRQARYPNGNIVLQGAYRFTSNLGSGIIWKDIPIIDVDENGNDNGGYNGF